MRKGKVTPIMGSKERDVALALATWDIRSETSPLKSERPRRKGEGMSSGNEPGSWGKDAVLR
jgi:hypothetical protein